MDCSEAGKYLSAFMDKELDGGLAELVAQHLRSCSECRRRLHELREADGRVRGLPRIDAASGFALRVLAAATGRAAAPGPGSFAPLTRMKRVLAGIREAIFGLFDRETRPDSRILDEFGDCPPLSMSFAYLKMLEQTSRG